MRDEVTWKCLSGIPGFGAQKPDDNLYCRQRGTENPLAVRDRVGPQCGLVAGRIRIYFQHPLVVRGRSGPPPPTHTHPLAVRGRIDLQHPLASRKRRGMTNDYDVINYRARVEYGHLRTPTVLVRTLTVILVGWRQLRTLIE